MGTKSITVYRRELLLVTVDWTIITDRNWSSYSIFIVLNSQHSPSLRYLLMEAWMHFNESVRNPVLNLCALKKILSRCMFDHHLDFGITELSHC
jgi:hypothetical protein